MPHFSLAKNKRFRSKGLSSKQNYNSKPHLVKVDFKKLGSAHEVPLYIIRKKNREREREREREKINSLLSQGTNPEQFYDHEGVLHTLDSLFLLPHSGSRQWVGGCG
jgi:hypothetical protein